MEIEIFSFNKNNKKNKQKIKKKWLIWLNMNYEWKIFENIWYYKFFIFEDYHKDGLYKEF